MLKKYILFITIIYTMALACLSLIKINNIPDYVPSITDKIFHFLTYGILTILWYYTWLNKSRSKQIVALILATLISISFGIIIEVLQDNLTSTRIFDLKDIFANVLGIIVAVGIITLKKVRS
ncbi:MAG TPA: VanZ family protein [Flavobacteriaceae bacterium]|nr:VanZ family protein [Flavobacteriaceae bacterium]